MWHSPSSRSNRRRPPIRRFLREGLERLEERQLLSYADFELKSLLPANGGNGSKGFVMEGVTEQGHLGEPRFMYEALGDVNQDGFDDFLVAAPGTVAVTPSPGPTVSDAYLVFGRAGGFPAALDLNSLDGTTGYAIHDGAMDDGMGFMGGGGGDLNHDGVPDLVLGAVTASPSPDRPRAGETFVFYGGSHLIALDQADGTRDGRIDVALLDGSHGFVINGIAMDDKAGRALGAGDINGDHIDDLVIGTAALNPVRTYVVFGRNAAVGQTFPSTLELSSLNGSNGFTMTGMYSSDSTRAGDVNGDGIGDLLIGDTSGNNAFVIFGRAIFPNTMDVSLLNGSNGFRLSGGAASNILLGYSAGAAGDVNGDGLDDIVTGALFATGQGGTAYAGAAYIVFGKRGTFPAVIESASLNGSNGFALLGSGNMEKTGGPATGVGDVNGDGFDDLVVGAAAADPNGITDAGKSFVVYGRANFAASFNLSSLMAANGGDGSAGFVLNGFLAGQNTRPAGIGDVNGDGFADLRIGAETDDPNGLIDAGRAYIVYGQASPAPATKFYVVDDAATDRTYEYTAAGIPSESYAVNAGNTAPRGAASTAAGDRVWVVDANKKVFVYNAAGTLIGSWTAGTLASNAVVEGIATNGTDIWIVDAQQDKVFRFTGAASRLSGSQTAVSSFSLNASNTSPKDIVTDGTSLWVVNDAATDKVFKYSLSGTLLGSWTITGAGSSPTGITLDPAGGGHLWVVDNGTDRVYQFDNARTRTSSSQTPSTSFALAAGNTNPQGIADPPVPTPGTSLGTDSHPSARLATLLGKGLMGLSASKLSGLSFVSSLDAPATSILIPWNSTTDQNFASEAGERLSGRLKRTRTIPRS